MERKNLTPQQKKKIRLEKNKLSARLYRKRQSDTVETIVEETGTVGTGYEGLNNAANEICKWNNAYTLLGKQFKEQKKQIANLKTKSSKLRKFIGSIPRTISDEQFKIYF